jgi:DNA invertase Pin-like site-specific DNA recombinase
MTVIGYARVSTSDQSLEIQETALKAGGVASFALKSAAVRQRPAEPSFRRCWIFLALVTY